RHPLCDDRDAAPDRRDRPPDRAAVPAPDRDRHRLWHRARQRGRGGDPAADRLAMVGRHRRPRRDRLARPGGLGALAGAAPIGYRASRSDGAPDAARRAQEDTMIKRLISLLFLAWVLGFAWFALLPPMPAPPQKTDAIVVLTGGPGRID